MDKQLCEKEQKQITMTKFKPSNIEKNFEKEFDKKFESKAICSPTGLIEIKCFIQQLLAGAVKENSAKIKQDLIVIADKSENEGLRSGVESYFKNKE